MSCQIPRALAAVLFALIVSATASAATNVGACPTGASYLDLSSPADGGGNGSVALSTGNAGGITTGCFYFSSSGSDTNSCTTEGSPCQHLPGMPNCASTCASITPQPGEGFIIQGGSIYHRQSGSPLMGGNWSWTASGNSSNRIYIGVDPSWYSAGSFARPIFDMDNPLTTSSPGSCAHAYDGNTLFNLSSASYVIVDGLEFRGMCLSGSGDASVIEPGTSKNQVFERNYMHGWSVVSSAADDGGVEFGDQANTQESTDRFLFNVVDGGDSTFGATCNSPSCVASGAGTGWAFGKGYDYEYNVIRHVSNGIQSGKICTLIGNSFEYLWQPTISRRHGNVVEENFGSCDVGLYYNNVTGNIDEGIGWVTNDLTFYVFNNVWFNDQHYAPDANGYILCGGGSGSNVATVYFYNNTAQDIKLTACVPSSDGGGWASGSTITFENNHIMDFTSVASFFNCNGQSCTVKDNGGEVFQSTTAAESQGYSYANKWHPTTSGSATVGAGQNTSSFCSSLPNAAAVTACKTGSLGAVSEVPGWGGYIASYPTASAANLRGSAWDAGAYQFAAGSVAEQPNPPSNLSAVVQ